MMSSVQRGDETMRRGRVGWCPGRSWRWAVLTVAVVLCQHGPYRKPGVAAAFAPARHGILARKRLLSCSLGGGGRRAAAAAEAKLSVLYSAAPPPLAQSLLASNSSFLDPDFLRAQPPTKIKTPTKGNPQDGFGTKLRKLKDLMWVREALEDLTAAEFACSVEKSAAVSNFRTDESVRTKRRRAVDYEKLLLQLNRRMADLGCLDALTTTTAATNAQHQSWKESKAGLNAKPGKGNSNGRKINGAPVEGLEVVCAITPGEGMGALVYTDDERQELLERAMVTRQLLSDIIRSYEEQTQETNDSDSASNNTGGGIPFSISLPEIRVEIPREDDPSSPGPKLYVRDDGTVDWDGALQDRAALQKFGTAVWARINGRDPETLDDGKEGMLRGRGDHAQHGKPKVVTAKIEDTPQIKEARDELQQLSKELAKMESEHTALLSSAIREGQAVANVNLAMLDPEQRSRIRESAAALEKQQEIVAFYSLLYELERIYTYLVGELGNPASTGYIPLQDRLNVAEFGLLEAQIDSFNRQLEAGDILDADVLAVVMDQVTDFKRRLGIDYYVTGLSFDAEGIKRFSKDLADKTKNGLAFYIKGVRLFWNDILFCLSLVSRAAQGYTLKPREVRTLRRTFKDVITFIPFIIILLIPLSPIGHVLVFGAIQRFFPDFFPSCFTEQRQNLLQLYENAEYSEFTINENWREKLMRASEAFFYFLTTTSKALFAKVSAAIRGDKTADSGPDGKL